MSKSLYSLRYVASYSYMDVDILQKVAKCLHLRTLVASSHLLSGQNVILINCNVFITTNVYS